MVDKEKKLSTSVCKPEININYLGLRSAGSVIIIQEPSVTMIHT